MSIWIKYKQVLRNCVFFLWTTKMSKMSNNKNVRKLERMRTKWAFSNLCHENEKEEGRFIRYEIIYNGCNFFFTAKCVAGHFSPNGLESPGAACQPCPIGTYNNVNGSTECKACPQGTTTLASGADNANECVGKSYEEIWLRIIWYSPLQTDGLENVIFWLKIEPLYHSAFGHI